MLTSEESTYYGRQLILSEFGPAAQARLKNSHVVVVGAGGLGCPALLYLAGAGVGHITIADADTVQVSNLHRQVLYSTNDIGKNKVDAASQRLKELNPYIQITSISHHISAANAGKMLSNADVVVDATDNFETRFMLGDTTAKLQIPLVFAAIFGFEGQLTVFNYGQGPIFRDLFPVRPNQSAIPDCTTNGVVGFVPGIMGCLQAAEAIKILVGIGEVMSGKLMVINLLSMDKKELRIKQSGYQYDSYVNETSNRTQNTSTKMINEISALMLRQRMDNQDDEFFLLDVREPEEFDQYNIGGTLIPLGRLPEKLQEVPDHKDIVVVCKSGVRSYRAAQFIAENFRHTNVFNLKGGLISWIAEVNTSK